MIDLFINALAASAGGGPTYIRNVLPQLAWRDNVRAMVLLPSPLRRELPGLKNVEFIEHRDSASVLSRFRFEQAGLRRLIQDSGANVLLSAGNFALLESPVPQILLSRNSLYTSEDFERDLRSRSEARLWIETQIKGTMARWSIQAADAVVAPSAAFAEELQRWSGRPVTVIHHGFDQDVFTREPAPLSPEIRESIDVARNCLRLLFVSHYNYYRNFETLIRALPLIRKELGSRELRLFLTCKLAPGANPGSYDPAVAAKLVRDLGLSKEVVQLDAIPYPLLHRLYRSADIYVTPAYAESFAHPLVEAMASGLPVVASDLAVHKEICGAAALYFDRFSPSELAKRVVEVSSGGLGKQLAEAGIQRAQAFNWKRHVDQIVELAQGLVRPTAPRR